MRSNRIARIEIYVKQTLTEAVTNNLLLAHDYNHMDRVRHNALRIAEGEGFTNTDMIEAAALLHDIGLTHMVQRKNHGLLSAEVAAAFLSKERLFAPNDITAIAEAISTHDSIKGGGGQLGAILRDADMLDMFGAIGIMRGCASHRMAEYDPANVLGETWGMSAEDFTQRFREGSGKGRVLSDVLNFHISCYDNLNTDTARQLAKPLVAFMRIFMLQLQDEVTGHGH